MKYLDRIKPRVKLINVNIIMVAKGLIWFWSDIKPITKLINPINNTKYRYFLTLYFDLKLYLELIKYEKLTAIKKAIKFDVDWLKL